MQLILCRGNVTTVFSRLSQYLSGWELQAAITQDLEHSSARCWRDVHLSHLSEEYILVCLLTLLWLCLVCGTIQKLRTWVHCDACDTKSGKNPVSERNKHRLLAHDLLHSRPSNKPFCTLLPLMNCEIVAQDWTPVSVHSWTILQEGSIPILCAGISLSKAEISSSIISQSSILHFL